jgi:hypothetical protein
MTNFNDGRPAPMYPRGRASLGPEAPVPVVPGHQEVPSWADLTNEWGRGPDPAPVSPAVQGYPPMNPPPWMTDPQKPAGRPIILAVLIAMLVTAMFSAGLLVQRLDLLPVSVPLVGKDTGVALCQVMAKGDGPTENATTPGAPIDAKQLAQIRAAFGDSRHEGIRVNGTKMIDLIAQIQALGEEPDMGALIYISAMADAYAGLAGSCAAVGHPLPAMATS